MKTVLVCAGMPVIPLLTYFAMSAAGITSIYKIIIPEIFVVLYVIFIAVLIAKKIEKEETTKKLQ